MTIRWSLNLAVFVLLLFVTNRDKNYALQPETLVGRAEAAHPIDESSPVLSSNPIAMQDDLSGARKAIEAQDDEKLPTKKGADQDFDGDAAYGYLKQVLDIGTRVSASEGMKKQIEMLRKHFEALGAEIQEQKFLAKDPKTGTNVELTNLVARWHPERTNRLLFCCHYDSRPFPDSDPTNPKGLFLGANDGGSGVAALCELGRFMADLDGKYGIDFVFFDGEEFVYVYKRDPMFLGSTFFAQEYARQKRNWKYEFGILLDMVGDADLQIHMEGNSLSFCPRLTRSIWNVANDLKIEEFKPTKKHTIRDDHLPLNQIGRIETCNIIDFDYPNPKLGNAYWHTEKDVLENCSADSLGKVGRVVLKWTRLMQEINKKK